MVINDKEVNWNEISREQLKHLCVEQLMSDTQIAGYFNISASQVRYKRKKLNLTRADVFYEKIANDDKELFETLDSNSKEWFKNPENIDIMSKAITNYIFRSGPVECMHSEGKPLSDADMKTLNIYMVNHIAGLLTYALNGNWMKLQMLMAFSGGEVKGWNKAEPELDKIEKTAGLGYNDMKRQFDKS